MKINLLIAALLTVLLSQCSTAPTAETYFKIGTDKYGAGFYLEALDAYSKAIKMKPDYYQAYNNRGNVKFKLGDKRGAIEDFNQSIKINSEFMNAYYNRANRRYELGEKVEACKDWKRAAEAGFPEAGDAYQKYCK